MPAYDADPHSLCSSFRGQECFPPLICLECASWPRSQWEKYNSRRKTVEISLWVPSKGNTLSVSPLPCAVLPPTLLFC